MNLSFPNTWPLGTPAAMRTLFSGIRKLMPGHHLTLRCDPKPELRIERYWEIPEPPAVEEQRSEDEWIRECRQRLEETVQMRLMSDVPLGMFLSGGVDSSAIAALMKRMVTGPVKTFAVGYSEAEFSELSYARTVSGIIGTEHHEVVVGMDDFFNALPKLIWHEDEPITWPSSVSLYFVSRLAAQEVKVVLTGEGSDELFAGYSRYRFYLLNRKWMDRYRMVPGPVRRWARSAVETSRLLSASLRRKLQHTFIGCGDDVESLYLDNFYSAFGAGEQSRLPRGGRCRPMPRFSTTGTAGRIVAARPHALCRSENLSGRVADEAGPDEHGDFDRKPRPLARSSVRRVRHARAGQHETARRYRQIHLQESGGRPAAARHPVSQEDGLPDASARVAAMRRKRPACSRCCGRAMACSLRFSTRAPSMICSNVTPAASRMPPTASGGC